MLSMNTLVLPSLGRASHQRNRIAWMEMLADVARVHSVKRMCVETVPDANQALAVPARNAFKRYGCVSVLCENVKSVLPNSL